MGGCGTRIRGLVFGWVGVDLSPQTDGVEVVGDEALDEDVGGKTADSGFGCSVCKPTV